MIISLETCNNKLRKQLRPQMIRTIIDKGLLFNTTYSQKVPGIDILRHTARQPAGNLLGGPLNVRFFIVSI